ncbi:hypothetical protein [Stenotrophomonas maltophilia]|jgi:hypothetical protein|uniref:hypothetical protein n=1 Tax=Stenotrophomonas maltophilia TaxID=40324 RepID=UPI00165578B9|nr:hypothetical protein [Stenotrophomonas maltophilia]MBC8772357.1 hypothetical protein [Stenotrophomonas maltophilia]
MLIPDPLRPYVGLIRAGLWVAAVGAVLLMGARLGADYRAKKDQALITAAEKARDKALANADENLRAANACGQLLQEVNRQTQLAIDESARQKAAANEAARRAEAAAAQSQRRANQAEQALQAAKNQPGCRQQLEQNLCDAIPLL